jgi:hypothetical protein
VGKESKALRLITRFVRYRENPYANRPRIETILCDGAVTDSDDLGGEVCRIEVCRIMTSQGRVLKDNW